ncbi:hypothetical protein A2774_04630 [Candidatus Roizmanbacteria bacterium RIFCSPHIGHO2_01_FULL_39_12c]|uniref:Nudix hydrolase domain-containing protein n=1 Tax=Candidatus Roizmanbacteria bacterium RIFCSPHIGHO2_01_FULL_39_12c TaxID=1802031 RepID=A0A1F7GCD4_9BACT|nr:MAG: hypothetical protein A2774_04630 [Candidatus Roizmanbacteria bacterium RIFCSPHIGHO2_01_FULL_39_12c]OGK47872.1 MAG: hypothetical protein A2963_03405 [Candidatus Roizmanbacteria bacterium RIFCSPLOWO2_01_FULL_40_13]
MPRDDQTELFVVVDKNDRIIGYKTRYECHHNNKLIHRGIGVILFNSADEILLQKRSRAKDLFPGYYSIATGGHVAKGETYLQAAKRELLEELGIRARLNLISKFIIKSERECEMNTIFKGVHNGPFKLDPDEVDKVEFFPKDRVRSLINKLTPFANKSLKTLQIL